MSPAPILNRRLALEEPQRLADGAGGFTETWVTLGYHRAEIRPGAGREREGEFVTVSRVPYHIIVRATPVGAPSRPKPEQRFREGTRLFRVLAVSEYDLRGRYLSCAAEEEVSA